MNGTVLQAQGSSCRAAEGQQVQRAHAAPMGHCPGAAPVWGAGMGCSEVRQVCRDGREVQGNTILSGARGGAWAEGMSCRHRLLMRLGWRDEADDTSSKWHASRNVPPAAVAGTVPHSQRRQPPLCPFSRAHRGALLQKEGLRIVAGQQSRITTSFK